jgi:hypothetical protein
MTGVVETTRAHSCWANDIPHEAMAADKTSNFFMVLFRYLTEASMMGLTEPILPEDQ